MSVHCACWKDGEPCCWCADDTDEDVATLPACTRVFTDDCVADLRQAWYDAEQRYFDAESDKRSRAPGVPVGEQTP